jgi:hypothetical protein
MKILNYGMGHMFLGVDTKAFQHLKPRPWVK